MAHGPDHCVAHGAAAIGLTTRLAPDGVVLGLIAIPMTIVLAGFAGMGLFAEERQAKTLAFLQVQPVLRWQILLAKVAMGSLVIAVPFTATFALVLVTVGARELSLAFMWFSYAVLLCFSMMMYLWQVFVGLSVKRPDVYAAVCVAVLGFWMIHGLLVDEYAHGTALEPWLWKINPFALVELLDAWIYRSVTEVWTVILVQIVIAVGLIGVLWLRFERVRERTS